MCANGVMKMGLQLLGREFALHKLLPQFLWVQNFFRHHFGQHAA